MILSPIILDYMCLWPPPFIVYFPALARNIGYKLVEENLAEDEEEHDLWVRSAQVKGQGQSLQQPLLSVVKDRGVDL